MNNQLNNLPDLPALESVEVKNWQMLLVLSGHIALGFLFAGMTVWLYLRFRAYLDARTAILVWLMGGLAVWSLLRVLFGGLYWKTDRRGLTMRGILCHKFIEWTEVEEARSKRTLTKELVYVLRTRKGTITAPTRMDGCRNSGQELAASIWQHLRHIGKADGLELPAEALTFWDIIPDDLPLEMDWQSPGQTLSVTRIALASVLMPAILIAAIICLACMKPHNWFLTVLMSLMLVPIIVLFSGEYRKAIRIASVFLLRDQSIEAVTPGGPFYALWSEVTGARWDRSSLVIHVGRRQLRVLYTAGNDDSDRLILAIIRRLRTAGQSTAVVIPEVLRRKESECRETVSEADPLVGRTELRPSLPEKALSVFCTLILLGMGPAWIDTRFHSTLATAMAVAVTILLGLLATNAYYYRITPEAVEKRLFCYHRRVSWEQVTTQEFRITPQHCYHKWILKDAGAKKLIDITLDLGAGPAKAKFEAVLTAQLAWAVPAAAHKPWLARPFSPKAP